jgi:leucyl/phenylalanyl-tRNA--protein transferase
MQLVLTPELILEAYRHGLFPMAYSGDSPYIQWVCPEERGQLSIPDIHIPRRLKSTIRSAPYEIKINTDFEGLIRLCAEEHHNRPETWINEPIITTFCQLHEQGHAHSIEAWDGNTLVGGVYGLAIGGAFFGESMVSRARDASKITLIHLCARLWHGGFTLLDTQFVNDHLQQFGIYELSHADYKIELEDALALDGDFLLEHIDEQQIISEYLIMRDQA